MLSCFLQYIGKGLKNIAEYSTMSKLFAHAAALESEIQLC